MRQKILQVAFKDVLSLAIRIDLRFGIELVDYLSAGSAGGGGLVGGREYDDDLDISMTLCDCGEYGASFGADCQPEGGVLDITSAEDVTLLGQDGRTYREVAEGTVSIS